MQIHCVLIWATFLICIKNQNYDYVRDIYDPSNTSIKIFFFSLEFERVEISYLRIQALF